LLIARMTKQGLAGPKADISDLKKKLDKILDGARKRAEQAK
jgi:hypothetical protein